MWTFRIKIAFMDLFCGRSTAFMANSSQLKHIISCYDIVKLLYKILAPCASLKLIFQSSRKCYRRRPWHASSENDMHDRRPIEDPSETNMPDPSKTSKCFIGDPSETNMPLQRLTCLIDNPLETDIFINKQKVYKIKYI